MPGLSDLIASTKETATELPDWYSNAQQSTINNAQAANVPAAQQTVGQQAVSTLSGQNNPFAQAQNILGDVASGASNPWLTDASGNVTANTATPLGGLFNAQNQYLNQILPDIDTQATAGAIGSGNFGSLRGLTAMNKARGDALSKMQADQYKTALESQDQAIKAASGLSNVGVQGIDEALKTAEWQQTSPLAKSALMSKILAGVGPTGKTEVAKTNLSPLAQAQALGTLAESNAGRSILGGFGVTGNNAGEMLGSIYRGITGGLSGLGGGSNVPAPSTEGWVDNGGLWTIPGDENNNYGGDDLVELGGGWYDEYDI